jgi:hypothetical protein
MGARIFALLVATLWFLKKELSEERCHHPALLASGHRFTSRNDETTSALGFLKWHLATFQ